MKSELTQEMLNLQPGDHLCLFYEKDPAEQLPALIPFIQQGLAEDEQFLYVADDHTVEQLSSRLEASGINVGRELERGRLKLWTRKEWRQPGELSSDRKAAQVRQFMNEALSAGFKGVRFAVEMTWTLGPDISARQLEYWEATINTIFVPGFPGRIICQYNQSRLAPEVLMAGLHTHPLAILGDQVCSNPFYQAPLILSGHNNGHVDGPMARAKWMLSQLKRSHGATKKNEQAEEASRRLAAIVECSDDAIVGKDLKGMVTSWNQGAERIFGYTADEMVGKCITILIPPDRMGEEAGILSRVRRGERVDHYETIRRRKNGRLVDVSLTVSPIKDSSGRIVGASKIARDISDRRKSERQQETFYQLITLVSRAAAAPDVYKAALDAVSRSVEADRVSILLYDGGVMRFKAWQGISDEYRRGVEGHSPWRPDEPDAKPICVDDIAKASLEPALHGLVDREGIRALAFVPIRFENRLLGKFMIYYDAPHRFTLEELRPVEAIASQVAFAIDRLRSGEALERLVNERTASLREAVEQMEEFSYSVSHDMRAPARAMQGYARAILEDYGDRLDAQGHDFLNRIISNGVRMDRLIQDILTYSRINRREVRLQPVSLDRLVKDIIQQNPEMQSPRAQVTLTGPLAGVIGHEPSLSQAICNLLANAVKFVPLGTTPEVHVRTEERGHDVRLSVEDNGIGIKPEYQHRLFGMFERIHPEKQYEGTGIGLAIVRRAVERMGGKAGMESDGINGSRFWIELPAARV